MRSETAIPEAFTPTHVDVNENAQPPGPVPSRELEPLLRAGAQVIERVLSGDAATFLETARQQGCE